MANTDVSSVVAATKKMKEVQKRILIVLNVDKFLISHRLPIALKAKRLGYEVHVACTITKYKSFMERLGLIVHPIELQRQSIGLLSNLLTCLSLYSALKKVNPDLVHLVSIKPVLIGGLLLNFFSKRPIVFAISGLGHVFTSERLITKTIKFFVIGLYKLALNKKEQFVICQNKADRAFLKNLISNKEMRTVLIPGSGVNLKIFTHSDIPKGKPTVMLASRLTKEKGIREFAAASAILKEKGVDIKFVLVGQIETEGREADIGLEEVNSWQQEKLIEWWGYQPKMERVLPKATVVVLPSYREGLPKVLCEAAAVGRPIITTDVPGCRDAIVSGVTGLLVPSRNAIALAETIEVLANNRQTCVEMGKEARAFACCKFDEELIVSQHMTIYEQALGQYK